jgi:hypothetical protein
MRGAVVRQFENPSLSATDDKRPEFQQTMGSGSILIRIQEGFSLVVGVFGYLRVSIGEGAISATFGDDSESEVALHGR